MNPEPITVVVCDDQAAVRDGLAALLSVEPDVNVVGVAASGEEAVELVRDAAPDLVLMDLNMPGIGGIKATEMITAFESVTKVLVLTTYADDGSVIDALDAGAAGYLLKDAGRADILAAIRGTVRTGGTHLDPAVGAAVVRHAVGNRAEPAAPVEENRLNRLTERERDILRLIAQGRSNPQIADALHLSTGTVRNHVSVILTKLDATDRAQAAALAVRMGIA